jgi:hypothetical protein
MTGLELVADRDGLVRVSAEVLRRVGTSLFDTGATSTATAVEQLLQSIYRRHHTPPHLIGG